MANTNISFRIDEDLKNSFEQFCEDVGMNMTTAFTMFMKSTLQKDRLPFAVERNAFYSEANMKHIDEGIRQIENGEYVTVTIDQLKELVKNG